MRAAPPCTDRGRGRLGGHAHGYVPGITRARPLQCCQTLVSHHVDPSLRDEDGYTAADLAEYHGHQACAQYLRETVRRVSLGVPGLPGGCGGEGADRVADSARKPLCAPCTPCTGQRAWARAVTGALTGPWLEL